jgi:hypothetical protein
MQFLHSVVSFPMGYVIAAIAVSASLLVLWISTLLSRRWYITIRKSEETELMALYLSRIADAGERMAAARESRIELPTPARIELSPPAREPQTETSPEASEPRHVGMSIFGR